MYGSSLMFVGRQGPMHDKRRLISDYGVRHGDVIQAHGVPVITCPVWVAAQSPVPCHDAPLYGHYEPQADQDQRASTTRESTLSSAIKTTPPPPSKLEPGGPSVITHLAGRRNARTTFLTR